MAQAAERKDSPKRDEHPQYRGLPTLLHRVRWTQHFFAILAEVLILLSFAASGMDVSIGGAMARIDGLAWIWAAIFAIGVDTSFVVSWVRVRQTFDQHRSLAFIFNLVLAIGMSIIVFQPVAIQLLQQSMSLSFGQALQMLGMNIVQLVYARAIVAVLLGALLATTNVEQKSVRSNTPSKTAKRTFLPLKHLLDKYAPVQIEQVEEQEQSNILEVDQTPDQEPVKQIEPPKQTRSTELKLVPKPAERIKQMLIEHPEMSDRAIAKALGVAPSTVGVHRKQIKIEQEVV